MPFILPYIFSVYVYASCMWHFYVILRNAVRVSQQLSFFLKLYNFITPDRYR